MQQPKLPMPMPVCFFTPTLSKLLPNVDEQPHSKYKSQHHGNRRLLKYRRRAKTEVSGLKPLKIKIKKKSKTKIIEKDYMKAYLQHQTNFIQKHRQVVGRVEVATWLGSNTVVCPIGTSLVLKQLCSTSVI